MNHHSTPLYSEILGLAFASPSSESLAKGLSTGFSQQEVSKRIEEVPSHSFSELCCVLWHRSVEASVPLDFMFSLHLSEVPESAGGLLLSTSGMASLSSWMFSKPVSPFHFPTARVTSCFLSPSSILLAQCSNTYVTTSSLYQVSVCMSECDFACLSGAWQFLIGSLLVKHMKVSKSTYRKQHHWLSQGLPLLSSRNLNNFQPRVKHIWDTLILYSKDRRMKTLLSNLKNKVCVYTCYGFRFTSLPYGGERDISGVRSSQLPPWDKTSCSLLHQSGSWSFRFCGFSCPHLPSFHRNTRITYKRHCARPYIASGHPDSNSHSWVALLTELCPQHQYPTFKNYFYEIKSVYFANVFTHRKCKEERKQKSVLLN